MTYRQFVVSELLQRIDLCQTKAIEPAIHIRDAVVRQDAESVNQALCVAGSPHTGNSLDGSEQHG